jgi:hypothetical protein
MKYQRPHRLPAGREVIHEVDKNRAQTPHNYTRGSPKSRPIYAPKQSTLAKQKAKITLPKITMGDAGDEPSR